MNLFLGRIVKYFIDFKVLQYEVAQPYIVCNLRSCLLRHFHQDLRIACKGFGQKADAMVVQCEAEPPIN